MPERAGLFGFGAVARGIAPYAERREVTDNAVDRWLERRLGGLVGRLPLARRRLDRRADAILAMGPRLAALDDDALRAAASALRPRLLARSTDHAAVNEAFAILREVSARVLGKPHYKVQIMGALALFDGRMVEMATGEGKTLTGAPAAAVAALAGMPVHVVTVNDYLAVRDAEELRPIFDFLGIGVGVIGADDPPEMRRRAYACDVTFVSNKNLTFDYLRDRVFLRQERGLARRRAIELMSGQRAGGLMLRGLGFAIVDEADSVFVDEARTPLILSATSDDEAAKALYADALMIVRRLEVRRDYTVDVMGRQIALTDAGRARLADLARGRAGLWQIRRAREELAVQGLMALTMFEIDRDYVILDGKVQIVDEFTGRVMADRSWQGGLHQMIEAKEGVAISGQKVTLARITYQRFFRRYLRLAGMTGTGMELAGEFRDTFGLFTLRIPRRKKRRLRHSGTLFLRRDAERWAKVAEVVAARHVAGQPVLVGTRSVEASERAAQALAQLGLVPAVLNARQDGDEAAIVTRAGQVGAITVATNIAGRGTDIGLGPGVAELGGLHVILTEYHESARIDRQLYGRAGRQGDPGSAEAIVSLEDELFTRFAPLLLRLARLWRHPLICGAMRRAAQARAEAEHATTRREQTRQDREMERSMAFTGSVE